MDEIFEKYTMLCQYLRELERHSPELVPPYIVSLIHDPDVLEVPCPSPRSPW